MRLYSLDQGKYLTYYMYILWSPKLWL